MAAEGSGGFGFGGVRIWGLGIFGFRFRDCWV